MTHPRKIIRNSVVDAIKAARTAAADRVWAGQEPPIDVQAVLIDEGPVILVYTRRDRVRDDDYPVTGSGAVKRTCDLCIEILAAGNHAVDDKLDDLAEVVETLIDGFTVPGQPASEIRLNETNVEIAEFEQTVGGAFLIYDACYWKVWREDPDADLDDDASILGTISARARGDAAEALPFERVPC